MFCNHKIKLIDNVIILIKTNQLINVVLNIIIVMLIVFA